VYTVKQEHVFQKIPQEPKGMDKNGVDLTHSTHSEAITGLLKNWMCNILLIVYTKISLILATVTKIRVKLQ
jgi:hypothetical protein